jgi:hypothetical protein
MLYQESVLTKPLRQTYQLKILLRDSKPPIWRRFLIDDSTTLSKLHQAIQIIMGWTNSHLHQFIHNNEYYGLAEPDFDMGMEIIDESKYAISQLLKKEKQSITYEYDFGDNWEHVITLEKITPFDPKQQRPNCIKAKGACPPEDIGGVWGYSEFLEAMNDSNHPEHESFKEWIGGTFDPDLCDVDVINQRLADYY